VDLTLAANLAWFGIVTGAIYALLAIGFSLVYGVLKMMNFAHGEVFMLAAFASWGVLEIGATSPLNSLPLLTLLPLMLIAAMAAGAMAAMLVERVAFRPLRIRGAGRLAPIISAVGASMAIRQAVVVIQLEVVGNASPRTVAASTIFRPEWHWRAANINFTSTALTIVGVSLLSMLAINWLVYHTRLGRVMRATAEDSEVAALMGVDIRRVIVLAFLLGGVLAGVGATFLGLYYGQIDHFIGFSAMIKAFIASVIGGIGSIRGAMAGGLLLGFLESLAVLWVDASYRDVIAFGVLILVLLLRPRGLLGESIEGDQIA
jgi:branched-chain amino acid transport system permease protein